MKHLKIIIALFAVMFSLTGCDKVPNNGDLDDMWQLMSIEEDGIVTNTKERQVYWSIRTNLVQFNSKYTERKYAHFTRNGNTLNIFDLCFMSANENEQDNDEWITYEEREVMEPWGLCLEKDPEREGRLRQTFTIELLNNDNMILTSGKFRLIFRKF